MNNISKYILLLGIFLISLLSKGQEVLIVHITKIEIPSIQLEINQFYIYHVSNTSDGYMVRGKSLGFVAANANPATSTIFLC